MQVRDMCGSMPETCRLQPCREAVVVDDALLLPLLLLLLQVLGQDCRLDTSAAAMKPPLSPLPCNCCKGLICCEWLPRVLKAFSSKA
jgi:hypothetical protein